MSEAEESAATTKELPFGVEYAKSGRSKCKVCHEDILRGSIRVSFRHQSKFFDGFQDHWNHFDCFWERARKGVTEGSFRCFETLKWEDQEKVRARIAMIEDMPDDAFATRIAKTKCEYAKAGNGKCHECKKKIEKDAVRINWKASNYHVKCFAKLGDFKDDAKEMVNFDKLAEEDQEELSKLFIKPVETEEQTKKRKLTEEEEHEAKRARRENDEPKREALKTQSDKLWEVTDELRTSGLKKADIEELVTANGGGLYKKGGVERTLEALADLVVFGALEPCPKCKEGALRYTHTEHEYKCQENISDYTKCSYGTREPARRPFSVPKKMLEKYADHEKVTKLDGSKMLDNRVYPTCVETNEVKNVSYAASTEKRYRKRNEEEERRRVIKNGCSVDPKCADSEDLHVYIEDKRPWQAFLSLADIATGKNNFYKLQLCKHDKNNEYFLFRSWGRTGAAIGGTKTEAFYDELDGVKEAFKELFMDKSGNDWDNIEAFKKRPGKLDLVVMDYEGGEMPSSPKKLEPEESESKLPVEVRRLISLIFDINILNQQMREFNLDLDKMPLGKLSRAHIMNAYSVLKELEDLLASDAVSQDQITDRSNKFFTLIPHSVGIRRLPSINNTKLLKEKTELLDNLLEMEIAYQMYRKQMKQEEEAVESKIDVFDQHYSSLKCDMEVLESDSDEYKLVETYMTNTHGKTHASTLTIKDIFKVARHGEDENFKRDMPNHQLLWHGSRTGNYAGILSQGLRIAPPEAPMTGYMFGKGVYFADMVSKSAQYCNPDQELKSDCLLLLCEVALGKQQEEKHAKMIKRPKPGYHSVKGLGGTAPNPKGTITMDDGVIVPTGKSHAKATEQIYDLLYNEYIVYKTDQVKMRYLIRVSIK